MRVSADKKIKTKKQSNVKLKIPVKSKIKTPLIKKTKEVKKKPPIKKKKVIAKPPIKKKIKKPVVKKKIKKKRKIRRILLVCLLTNKVKKINIKKAELLAKKLRFENIDLLVNNYISREACKMLRQGCSEAEIRLQYKNTENVKDIPFDVIKRYIKTFSSAEKMAQKRRRKIVKDVLESRECNGASSALIAVYEPVALNLNNPGDVQYLTQDTCWRPDIYLDNDHSCNTCYLKDHCLCPLKKIKKNPNVKTIKRFK